MRALAVIVVTAGDYYWSWNAVRDMFGPLLTQDDMMLASHKRHVHSSRVHPDAVTESADILYTFKSILS